MKGAAVIDIPLYRDRPVLLLCAPAGFGKTRAMRALAERLAPHQPFEWLDGAALARTDAGAVLQQIGEGLERRLTIFIDDAHLLPEPAREGLRATFDAASAGGRLIIGARSLDGLHFARWQAEGGAQLIDGRLLRLSRAQLAKSWGGRLTAEQLRQVDLLAEGWAAPARLLCEWLAAEGRFDPDGLFLQRSLAGTFVEEEVLATLPEPWLGPLMAGALPASFDQPLLDRLAPPGTHPTMSQLEARLGPLLIETGVPGHWRFNALLRRVLASRLDMVEAERAQGLRAVAADWAIGHGDVVTAVRLGGAGLSAARLNAYIERVGGLKLWLTHGYDDLRALVEAAGALGSSEPRLKLMRCVVLLKDGRAGEADRLYEEAVAELPEDSGAQRDAALVHATLLIYGCRAASPGDESVFRQMRDYDSDPAFTTMLPTLLAIRHAQQGELDQAMADIAEARAYAQATGVRYNLMFLDLHAAGVAQAQGDLAGARRMIASARRRWRLAYRDDRGAETVIEALAAQVAFEQGRFAEAARHVQRSGRRLPGSEAWFDIYVAAFETMIRLQEMEDGIGPALATLEKVRRQLLAQSLDRVAALLSDLGRCIIGEAWLRSGDPQLARRLAAYDWPPIEDGTTWQEREIGLLGRAYAALASDETEGAADLLVRLIGDARQRRLRRSEMRAWLLRTAVAERAGRNDEANHALIEAVRLGAASGARAAFGLFGADSVARRLAALRADPPPELEPFLKQLPADPAKDGQPRLTRREAQIIAELAAGGSDKMIGRRMGISEHAVRFHLKNLFRKLGVRDRASAASRHRPPVG